MIEAIAGDIIGSAYEFHSTRNPNFDLFLPSSRFTDDTVLTVAVAGDCPAVFVLDNHSPHGGLGDYLLNTLFLSRKLRSKKFYKFAVEGFPACGTPAEALAYHRLDGRSLVERILTTVDG
ncbi:MAG: hypothetical protein V1823_03850 [Chloroflexota bacterium]